MKLKTTRVPKALCPGCGYAGDAATAMRGQHTPQVGDIAICINCGAINEYGPGLAMVKSAVTLEQMPELERRAIEIVRKRGPFLKETKH